MAHLILHKVSCCSRNSVPRATTGRCQAASKPPNVTVRNAHPAHLLYPRLSLRAPCRRNTHLKWYLLHGKRFRSAARCEPWLGRRYRHPGKKRPSGALRSSEPAPMESLEVWRETQPSITLGTSYSSRELGGPGRSRWCLPQNSSGAQYDRGRDRGFDRLSVLRLLSEEP